MKSHSPEICLGDFLTFLEDRERNSDWGHRNPTKAVCSVAEAITQAQARALNVYWSGPISSEAQAFDYQAYQLIAAACQEKFHTTLNASAFRLIVGGYAQLLGAKLKEILDWKCQDFEDRLAAIENKPLNSKETQPPAPTIKHKRSTEQGEARVKLIGALTKHHRYSDNSCLNLEPIGNNELARAAGVSPSTASAFFTKRFKGHKKYQSLCSDTALLLTALKLLNDGFSPHDLYGRRPANEDDRDDDNK